MNSSRPKIKVPLQPLDIVLDICSVAIILLSAIYTIIQYSDLSDTIPTHFNFNGEADGFGHKSTLLLLPVLNVGLFILLFILNKFPHLHNYMVNITEENALKNYRLSTRILRFTNLFVTILFAFVQYQIIESAHSDKNEWHLMNTWLMPTIIGISLLLPIILVAYQYKMNKK